MSHTAHTSPSRTVIAVMRGAISGWPSLAGAPRAVHAALAEHLE